MLILLETRPSMEDSYDLNERGSNIRGSNFNRARDLNICYS